MKTNNAENCASAESQHPVGTENDVSCRLNRIGNVDDLRLEIASTLSSPEHGQLARHTHSPGASLYRKSCS